MAQKRATKGYTHQKECGFDVAEHATQNKGVGEFTNMIIDLGIMYGISGTVGGMIGDEVNDAFAAVTMQSQTVGNASVIIAEQN